MRWIGVLCLALGCAQEAGELAGADGGEVRQGDARAPDDPLTDGGVPLADGGDQDGSTDTDPDASQPPTCEVIPAPATARLLTRLEYDNIVRDVLGDVTRPAQALPPENEVLGFDNNAEFHRATPALIDGYLELAEIVGRATAQNRLGQVAPCDPSDTAACRDALLDTTARRLFRRTLRPAERAAFVELFDEVAAARNVTAATRLTLTALLQSPQFLYRLEEIGPDETADAPTPLSAVGLAGRLAAFLWASTPDDALLDAAENGQLRSEEQVRAEVVRMLADPRARDAVAHFHRQWLGLKALDNMVKDHAQDFPGTQDELRTAYAASIHAFIEAAFWSEGDGMAALIASPTLYLPGNLATLFGVDAQGQEMVAVSFPEQRAGLLTQPALLARLAHPEQTSPIHRGIFVRERLLCQGLPPPPNDVVIEPPRLDPNATTRERFAQHTEEPLCQGCHVLIDPIGFGFENYDELGRFRLTENGRPVDASGDLVEPNSPALNGPFDGAVELSQRLAGTAEVRRCVATQWFRFANARGEQPSDRCALDRIQYAFVNSGSFEALLVELAVSDAFRTRPGVVIGDVPPLPDDPIVVPEPDPEEPMDPGRPPQGFLDGVNDRGEAHGWTFDPDTPEVPTLVDLFLDGPPGEGLFLGGFRANSPRPDVNAAHPEFPGDHGFIAALPEVAKDGLDHTLYAVARNSGEGVDFTLSGSPRAFRAGLNSDPQVEPDTPNEHLPVGFVDVVREDGLIAGWALDRDVQRPIEVHAYLDGPALGGGTFIGSTMTGIARPDVVAALGHPGDHGWHLRVPPEAMDGQPHQVYVYAFNAGHPGNVNLSRSPMQFIIGGAP